MNDGSRVAKTVEGIVAVLTYVGNHEYPLNLGDIIDSYSHVGDPHGDIFEFVKDGISKNLIDYIASGDGKKEHYRLIWDMTDRYLHLFGNPHEAFPWEDEDPGF